jgi:hypoxanthine-guanine phosphoribosyltransferase
VNRRDAQRLLDEADLLCAADEVDRAVERMASDISAKLADEFPVVLSVMGGAAVFTGRLPTPTSSASPCRTATSSASGWTPTASGGTSPPSML